MCSCLFCLYICSIISTQITVTIFAKRAPASFIFTFVRTQITVTTTSMSDHTFSRLEVVDFLHRLFVSLDSQGLDCVSLILDAVAAASAVIPALRRFHVMATMIFNFKARLDFIARHERQSGVYHTLLGSIVGRSTTVNDLRSVIGIDRRTAKKTITKLQHRKKHFERTGRYLPAVDKPIIKRSRSSPALLKRIEAFFLAQSSPSADKTKVKRQRLARGKYLKKPVQYRTSTLAKLLSLYRVC